MVHCFNFCGFAVQLVLAVVVRYRDSVDTLLRSGELQCLLPNLNVLVAVSKGMRA